ncbi:MAG: IclR family transcriptional regulator [Desulfatiglandaceae bacterium]|jgi:DNA-binding IclR family transcriptional regulator
MARKYQAPAVGKAFEILQLISKSIDGLGLSDLANALEMSKGTVHGVASALEELGAILRDPRTRKFTLGLTLFELGRRAYSQIDLKDLARPILEELNEKTGETTYIGVLNGRRITILDVVDSRHDLNITSPKGSRIPLFAGAAGKVILASMEEERCREMIMENEIPQFTENSITDPQRYIEEIKQARQMGYATDYEEYLSGVWAVASPIRGWKQVPSAIWVVGFKTGQNEEGMETLIRNTKHAAEEISQKVECQRTI